MSKAKKALKLLIISALLVLASGCFASSASAASKEVKTLAEGRSYSITGYYSVTSSKSSVAAAVKESSKNYTIQGLKKGKATLKCYNKKGTLENTIYLLVTNDRSFVYDTAALNLEKGKTKKAAASTNFPSGITINYASSNQEVATVSSSGKITAVKAGSATIKAEFCYMDTKVKSLKKTVNVYSSSYNTNPIELTVGNTEKVSASVSGNCSVNYSSSDTSVAKVNANGKITALKKGTAVITCRVSLGETVVKTYTKEVTVNELSNKKGKQIANYAVKYVGNPYVYGGTSLTNGADCSGFVQTVFAHFDYKLLRSADEQMKGPTKSQIKAGYTEGKSVEVSLSTLLPGDLLFYGSSSYASHVAIYIGNGQIVHASNSQPYPEGGIKISNYDYRTPVKAMRYWS